MDLKKQPAILAALVPSFLANIANNPAKSGVSLATLAHAIGLDVSQVWTSDHYLDIEQLDQAINIIYEMTQDSALGLHIGEHLGYAQLDLLGHLFLSSQTVSEAIQRGLEFSQLFFPLWHMELEIQDDLFTYSSVASSASRYNHIHNEIITASVINMGYTLAGQDITIKEIKFQHPAPVYLEEYQRIFNNIPFSFGHCRNEIIAPSEVLAIQLPTANIEYHDRTAILVQKRLNKIKRESNLANEIIILMRKNIKYSLLSLQEVAKQLKITPRTLQRKLKLEQSSYLELRDQVRFEAAKELLANSDLQINEIGQRLGFIYPTNFYFFFKRCGGQSPLEFRSDLGKK